MDSQLKKASVRALVFMIVALSVAALSGCTKSGGDAVENAAMRPISHVLPPG